MRRSPGMLLAAIALATVCGSRPVSSQETFERVVAEFPERARDLEIERRAHDLVRQPGALEAYLALEAAGGWRDGDGAWTSPGPAQQRLLERTAELFTPTAVVQHVRAALATRPGGPWRRVALDLLGRHASSTQLALLAEVASDPSTGRPSPELVEPFVDGLALLLRREGVRTHELVWLTDASASLTGAVIRAVGRAGAPEGLDWLSARLGNPEHVAAALQEIGRVASLGRGDRPGPVADAVHPLLQSADEPVRRAAIRALSALGQPTSVPRLVALLEREPSAGERRMAVAALQTISAVPLPADPAAWRDWYTRERRWRDEEGERALARLDSDDPAAVVAAVRELAGHPLFRDPLTPPLAALLARHESATVRAQVCLALAHLSADGARPALEAALDDDDAQVRALAARALGRFRAGS